MRSSVPRSPISQAQLHTLCALDETGERALEMAVRQMNLSARVLRVDRPVADPDGRTRIEETSRQSGSVSESGSELLELTASLTNCAPVGHQK